MFVSRSDVRASHSRLGRIRKVWFILRRKGLIELVARTGRWTGVCRWEGEEGLRNGDTMSMGMDAHICGMFGFFG